MNVIGKVAIITGGARGLGRGFTEALLDRGANVVIADVQVDLGLDASHHLQKKYGQGRVMFIACDVTSQSDMNELFRSVRSVYGRVDIMVNNAGISEESQYAKMVAINLAGVIRGTLLAIENMQGGGGGVIINMGSTSGLRPVPFIPAYAGTKYGVVGFSRSIAGTVGNQGMRVLCLCPSFTETEMFGIGEESQRARLVEVPKEFSKDSVGSVGVMKSSEVVTAFMRLLDDTHNNGAVMAVTPRGMEYRFPRALKGKL